MTGGSDILDRLRAAPGRLSRPKSAGWLQLSPPFAGTGALALTGPVLLVLTVALAAWLGFTTYAPHDPEAALGIAVGSASFVAMALALILAARPRLPEPLFGGLDRMYRAHRWLGITALLAMVLHDMIDPDFDRLVRETSFGHTAKDIGEFAFNAFLVLIALSLLRRLPLVGIEIPYRIWRFSHRFMGALFALVAFHMVFVDMPAGVAPTLSLMLNGFAIAGLVAWIVTEFIAPVLRRRNYTVNRITRQGDSALITLAPRGRAMRWRPGQFVFLGAPEAGMGEPHPFTIASAPRADGSMTLAIRALGGWTRRLPGALREGAAVRVEGPYGRFDFRQGGARQVWLAGGIGITPFLAWAESLPATESRQIHLIHCVRTEDEAIGQEVLAAAAARNSHFSHDLIVTGKAGRMSAERLIASTPFAVGDADLWFCGPDGLRQTVLDGLAGLGQRPQRLRFERFDLA